MLHKNIFRHEREADKKHRITLCELFRIILKALKYQHEKSVMAIGYDQDYWLIKLSDSYVIKIPSYKEKDEL